MQDTVIIIIRTIIIALLLLTTVLFLTSILRRAYNGRKYRKLDHLRNVFDKKIRESLDSSTVPGTQHEFIARRKSHAWQAIEDVLLRLINEERYQGEAQKLFSTLGYVLFYEKKIENSDVQVRALGIDKLGRMKSEASVPKLITLLDEKNPEIVSVAVRSLSKIGGPAALQAIVERLPVILDRSIVTRKAMGMAMQSFGAEAIPLLVACKAGGDNLWVISCILDILSRLPADPRSARLAAGHLSSKNAEVRSKALKVLGRDETVRVIKNLLELVLPLLQDPVWFVRLQAIRSIRALGPEAAAPSIGKLIFDENWQVRNEAAQALTVLGEGSLDIFLDILTGTDRYAKDSICEEIEKTNFSYRLIKNLRARDRGRQKKSRQVLEIMHSLGFSTPLSEYLEQEGDEAEKELIRSMMKTGSAA
ncbi:MAG: HEAT repeat domain-containing protein [Nitrospirae bacterium]|nr:HEAT repeat domain-containing protein [Nitrospirota bacterium]